MKISGSYTFNAPQDEVWALLMDPDAIAKAIPGVDHFAPVGDHIYEAQIKLGLGAVSGQYSARITLSDIEAPIHYKMTIGGKGQRGFVNASGTIDLVPQDDRTLCNYAGDAALGGQLAGVSQRLMEGAAKTIIAQGFKSLDGQLAERRAAAAVPAIPEGVGPAARPVSPPPYAPAPAAPSVAWPWVGVAAVATILLIWLLRRD
ncbi:MAG: carbon monoxide dehydrogenase subunit G [Anaerolineae bacterium]